MTINTRPPAKIVWEDNYLVRDDIQFEKNRKLSLLDFILCRTRL